MHKPLPFFKWYPADADTDANFRAMEDADIGYYIRLLNHAWVNGGIPADPKTRSRMMKVHPNYDRCRWVRVGTCWKPSPNDPTTLQNTRMEIERNEAASKSAKAAESVNRRYERRYESPTTTETNVGIRASVSVSGSVSSLGGVQGGKPKRTPDRCQEWLRAWPRVGNPQAAVQAWISVVCTPEDEAAAFAARDRYLASDEVARNVIQEPAKWLYDQARGGWQGKWPAAKKDSRVAAVSHRLHEAPRQYSQAEIDAMAADDDPRIRQVAEELSQMRVS